MKTLPQKLAQKVEFERDRLGRENALSMIAGMKALAYVAERQSPKMAIDFFSYLEAIAWGDCTPEDMPNEFNALFQTK